MVRTFWLREAAVLKRFDKDVLARSSQACAVTPRDATEIGSRCQVIGMWPEAPPTPLGQLPIGSARSVLFFGHLDFPPNAEAARWIAHSLSRSLERDISVHIAGRGGSRVLRASPHYRGEYRRLIDLVDSSTVAVAPVVVGSGLQTKVLEAAVLGVPTIVTPFVAAGLIGPLPRGIVVCERTATAFATAIDDMDFSEETRVGLRAWVDTNYSKSAIEPIWRLLIRSAHVPC